MLLVVPLGFEPKIHRYERYVFVVYTTEPYCIFKKLVRQIRIERISSGLQPDALPFELPTHILVDSVGVEPTTPCLQNKCSPAELTAHIFGAECRNRTYYLLITSQLL